MNIISYLIVSQTSFSISFLLRHCLLWWSTFSSVQNLQVLPILSRLHLSYGLYKLTYLFSFFLYIWSKRIKYSYIIIYCPCRITIVCMEGQLMLNIPCMELGVLVEWSLVQLRQLQPFTLTWTSGKEPPEEPLQAAILEAKAMEFSTRTITSISTQHSTPLLLLIHSIMVLQCLLLLLPECNQVCTI